MLFRKFASLAAALALAAPLAAEDHVAPAVQPGGGTMCMTESPSGSVVAYGASSKRGWWANWSASASMASVSALLPAAA